MGIIGMLTSSHLIKGSTAAYIILDPTIRFENNDQDEVKPVDEEKKSMHALLQKKNINTALETVISLLKDFFLIGCL